MALQHRVKEPIIDVLISGRHEVRGRVEMAAKRGPTLKIEYDQICISPVRIYGWRFIKFCNFMTLKNQIFAALPAVAALCL